MGVESPRSSRRGPPLTSRRRRQWERLRSGELLFGSPEHGLEAGGMAMRGADSVTPSAPRQCREALAGAAVAPVFTGEHATCAQLAFLV